MANPIKSHWVGGMREAGLIPFIELKRNQFKHSPSRAPLEMSGIYRMLARLACDNGPTNTAMFRELMTQIEEMERRAACAAQDVEEAEKVMATLHAALSKISDQIDEASKPKPTE